MGFIDKYLLGKKGANEGSSKRSTNAEPEDPLSSVQEMYGLTASAPSVRPPPRAAPQMPGGASGDNSPATAPTSEASPGAAVPAASLKSSDGPDALDSPLRDLFTETMTMDPALVSLLKRVEKLDAKDLASDLKDFARSIGAGSKA